jgi:hypothetical protein
VVYPNVDVGVAVGAGVNDQSCDVPQLPVLTIVPPVIVSYIVSTVCPVVN